MHARSLAVSASVISLAVTASIATGVIVTTVLVESISSSSAQTTPRQLPEYTADGDLMLPKNWREWVFVGSPLTPNALNNGKAGFPEYHNVYIEPGSYEIFKKTLEFPDGTILFKELQLTVPPAEFPDGSRTSAFREGLFPRSVQRRRCDRQGFKARRVVVLQHQSS